ncbi:PAS domain S-box protein [Uliginosibacterium sp. H1]|uniref:PAS domain S-box protein n=1 Tax=Uliginosibacterium sp. H1 TaxID=3114757 RepID=UPI002E16DD9A|nr:PAS domain S-box protein [Uliginosibacterium sp. H1]
MPRLNARLTAPARLLLWLLIAVMVPFALFAALVLDRSQRAVELNVQRNLEAVAAKKQAQIERWLDERLSDAGTLAVRPGVAGCLQRFSHLMHDAASRNSAYGEVEAECLPLFQHDAFAEYSNLLLIAEDGQVVYTTLRESDLGANIRSAPLEVTRLGLTAGAVLRDRRARMSGFEFYAPANAEAGFFVAPVLDAGRVVGVLALQVDQQRLLASNSDNSGLGTSGHTAFARLGPGKRLQAITGPTDDSSREVAEVPDLMLRAVAGEAGVGRAVDTRGVAVIAAWRAIPALGWGMVVRTDVAEAMAPVRDMRAAVLQIGVLALLGAMGAALLYWRRVVQPIGVLADVSQRIAEGDNSSRAPVRGDDTVRALAESFNAMMDRLQSARDALAESNSELEQRIRARTEDLQRLVETLDVSDRKFRRVIDASQIGLWHLDVGSGELVLSGHPQALHGHRAEDIRSIDTWLDLVHPDDRANVRGALWSHLGGNSDTYDVTYRVLSSDGVWRWNHDNGKVVEWTTDRRAVRALGVSQDVTHSKQAESRLLLTQFFMDNVGEWTVMIDRSGLIRDANATAVRSLGYSMERLLTMRIWDLDPELREAVWPQRWQEFRRRNQSVFETRHQTADGISIPVEVSTTFQIYQGEEFICATVRDISARRQAEAALQEERELFTSGPVVIFKWRNAPGWPVEYVSRNVADVLGYPAEAFVKGDTGFLELVHAEDLERVQQEVSQSVLAQHLTIEHAPYRVRRADGEERWLFDYTMILRDAEGEVSHYFGYVLDITEQQLAQQLLVHEKALLRGLLDSVPDLISYKNPEGIYLGCNRAFARFMGRSEEEIIGRSDYQLSDAEAARVAREADREVVASGQPRSSEEWSGAADGRQVLLDTLKTLFRDDTGNVLGLIGISRDMTERQAAHAERERLERELHLTRAMRAEQAVAAAQERTHVLLESITQGIMEVDNDGRITYLNTAAARTLGHDKQDLVGRAFALCVRAAPTENEASPPPILPLPDGASGVHDEQRLYRHDGSTFVAEYSCLPLHRGGAHVGAVMVFRDVSERRIVEDRLRQMSRAVEQSPVAVVITDINGRIEYVNPKFCESSGYSEREVLGQSPRLLASGSTSDEEYAALWRNIASGQSWHGEFLNQRRDGSQFWESVSVSPIKDAQGAITHYIGIKEDISERKAFEEELRGAKDAAEAATQAKSQFLASMSHEIRTPMNAILGMTNLALKTSLDAKQHNYIAKAHSAANALLGVINDILDFSKIEAGKLAMEAAPFALQDVLDNVANVVGLRAQEKGLALAFDLAPNLPHMLVGDPLRLAQVLINLGTNAIKFTAEGQVRCAVSLLREEGDDMLLQFDVSDTGIGISKEQQQRLFQPFSQADASTTRRYGGSGLGLVICRQLVDLMHGEIGVDSEPGQGATFWFTARLGRASAILRGSETRSSRLGVQLVSSSDLARFAERLSGAEVLLVEDYPLNQELAIEFLRAVGINVAVAAHGVEALSMLAERNYDAVLMDCQMPVMDGYTAAAEIRRKPQWRDLPIVAMTADAMAEDRERVLAVGMNDHVAKPIDPHTLYATLQRWIKRRPDAPAARPREAPAAGPGVPLRVELLRNIDHEAGLVRAMGKQAFYRRLLGLFLQSQSGFEEGLRAALAAGSSIDAQRYAHTLKGSAGHIGARAVEEAARILDDALRGGAPAEDITTLTEHTVRELRVVLDGIRSLQQAEEQAAAEAASAVGTAG